jgi:TldD protein
MSEYTSRPHISPFKKFFTGSDLTPNQAQDIVKEGLKDADYGELYQEIVQTESLVKDKGEYSTVSLGNSKSGFGVRVGKGTRVGYSYSDVFNEAALKQAIDDAQRVLGNDAKMPHKHNFGHAGAPLYDSKNPMASMTLEEKITKIDEIEAYIKAQDPNITNVTIRYTAEARDVHIITSDGKSMIDTRPNVGLAIMVQVTDEHGNSEVGREIIGGPVDCTDIFDEKNYKKAADHALTQAKLLLIAEEAPAGEMEVVLNQGWPSVLLHEAVGHGLEGDFNRRDISVYSGEVGKKVASDEVTVIDQGNMPGERGSLHFDDEGIPTQKNVLIENGVLKKYMQDRQNAMLMGTTPTGNGRRESYKHTPMPRMTNTYFKPGKHNPADIIKSVKDGLFIADMGGGQVNITSGKFNMNATLCFRIKDGKLGKPVKGATLVGDGLGVIQSIKMVGNDLLIEKGKGMCGKSGQKVRVASGQPTIRVSNMTVGGSKR